MAKSANAQRHWLVDLLVKLVKTKPLGAAFGAVVLALILVSIFADVLAPYPYDEIRLMEILEAPSASAGLQQLVYGNQYRHCSSDSSSQADRQPLLDLADLAAQVGIHLLHLAAQGCQLFLGGKASELAAQACELAAQACELAAEACNVVLGSEVSRPCPRQRSTPAPAPWFRRSPLLLAAGSPP